MDKVAHLQWILKMNLLRGLYFPGTGLKRELFRSLSGLFDRIDFYLVSEEDQEDVGKGDDADSWQGKAVLPLGDDHQRFMAMLKDIQAHAGEYYEGCLAGLSDKSQEDPSESSVWKLVASLHGEEEGQDEDPALIEKQWQARLFLKLAEIVAAEQEEIDRGLANFRQKEQALFSSLKGEQDGVAEVAGIFGVSGSDTGGRPNSTRARHLLAAWGVFFASDPCRHDLLFTDNEDAAAALFNAWEEICPEPPQLLAELMVPGPGSDSGIVPAGLEIAGALNALVAGEEAGDPGELAAAVAQWQKESTAAGGDKGLLSIYLFQGVPLEKLWPRISGMTAVEKSKGDQLLVGVLRPPS
jgi:hypothetical protein